MTSPLTRGLIHGVAMQSSVPAGCEIKTFGKTRTTLARGSPGCGLRYRDRYCSLPTRQEHDGDRQGGTRRLQRVCARLRTQHGGPCLSRAADQDHRRPTPSSYASIIGNTSRETWGWSSMFNDEASYVATIEKLFGAAARDRILKLYPTMRLPSARAAFVQATTDAQFTCVGRRVARTILEGAEGAGLSVLVRSFARK